MEYEACPNCMDDVDDGYFDLTCQTCGGTKKVPVQQAAKAEEEAKYDT